MAAASKMVKWALCLAMFGIFFLYWILLLHTPTATVDPRNDHKLVIILLDGFGREQLRHLLATSDESAFKTMAKFGVSAEFMRPIFPTMTLPNHYALFTGMFAEEHGVVHERIYDNRTGEEYSFDKRPALWISAEAEPLWRTIERHGKRVHLSTTQCHKSVPVLNITASCKMNRTTELKVQLNRFETNLKDAIRRVAVGDDVLGIVHAAFIHDVIHIYGPASVETEEAVEQMDEMVGNFLHAVSHFESKINVMVMSDVGLAPVSDKKPLFIESSLNLSLLAKAIGSGAHYGLWPVPGEENNVVDALRHQEGMRVQTKDDGHLLEKLHYKKHDLIAPIQVVAENGYFLKLTYKEQANANEVEQHHGNPNGIHGYDPFHVEDMKAIFYAQGPQFMSGSKIGSIRTTDVYNILRNVLQLDAAKRHVIDGVHKIANMGHH